MAGDFFIPKSLAEADFTRLVFTLTFNGPFDLTLEAFLRLRRGLLQASRAIARNEQGDTDCEQMIEPPLSMDPVARRRFQRPAPAFVLRPPVDYFGHFLAGDSLRLEVLFLGGMAHVAQFTTVLTRLGAQGLFSGEGRFSLTVIQGLTNEGTPSTLWQQGQAHQPMAPPISQAKWWLEDCPSCIQQACLDFITPARLLSRGRPLFAPTFEAIFPFILRRVTSMLYTHCDLEIIGDPRPVLEAAQEIEVVQSDLRWEDWRSLPGRQDLGGLLGKMYLKGNDLEQILWILHLGSMLHIGKGASYGAGYFRVLDSPSV